MYISKPQKGFLLPVTYIENKYLYDGELEIKFRNENIEDKKIEEDTQIFSEKRDRLFDEESTINEQVKVKKYTENFKGTLVFDDIDLDETRKFTEVNEEKVGKLVFETDDLQDENTERDDETISEEVEKENNDKSEEKIDKDN